LLDKTQDARQCIFDRARAIFVSFAPHSDRVRHIAPDSGAGFFKFAQEKSFLSAAWKKHVNRFEVSAGHGKDVRGAINQIGGKRLAPLIADVYAIGFANLHRVKTWWLTTHCVHAGRSDFDIFAIADQSAKESLSDRAATNIAGANKEDAFHDGAPALADVRAKLSLNAKKVNRAAGEMRVCGLIGASLIR